MPEFIVKTTAALWADALFVSVLQRSDNPDAGQVRQAIVAAVQAYGDQGCAQRVAQAFGDHPETAVTRMHWARAVASKMPGSPPGPRRSPHPPPGTSRRACVKDSPAWRKNWLTTLSPAGTGCNTDRATGPAKAGITECANEVKPRQLSPKMRQ